MSPDRPEVPMIRPPSKRRDLTIERVERKVRMFQVFEAELDDLAEPSEPLPWTLFGITVGIAVAAVVVLVTVTLTPMKLALFVGMLVASVPLAIFFGVRGYQERKTSKSKIDQIKERNH